MSWYHSSLLTPGERRSSRLIASCKRLSRRLSSGILRAVINRIQTASETPADLLAYNLQQPRSLEEIMKCTRFTKAEIRLLYRSFKQECPGGNVSEDRLRSIYLQFFPQGNANKYTHYLFSMMDRNRKGAFTFDDYILTLSILCRGTIDEKLRWIFRFYDLNNQGHLTRQNVSDIVLSLYELLGPTTPIVVDEMVLKNHVEEIFQQINPVNPACITVDDLIDYCKDRTTMIETIEELSCCL